VYRKKDEEKKIGRRKTKISNIHTPLSTSRTYVYFKQRDDSQTNDDPKTIHCTYNFGRKNKGECK